MRIVWGHLANQVNIYIYIYMIFLASILTSITFSDPTFATTHSLSMSTSGTVNVDVSTTGNGTAVGQDNLTIISTCPNGYTVTIKGPNNTNLYKDGNTANNATNTKITSSAGTISNPLPITDNTSNGGANYRGTWGYSLTSSTGTGNFIGLTSTTTTLFTKNTASGDGNVTPNGTSTGTTDIIPIYYGVSTTLDQAPGLYTMSSTNNSNGAITYFITTPQSCTSYTVAYNPTSTANSTTLTGTGTMPNQTISEDTATNLNTNAFAAPTGYSFNGWNTKQDGTGTHYANNTSVTNLISAGQTITLYAEWTPNSYTCTKRYRLQNADGTFPDTYTSDTTEQVPYNTTCTYTKSVTDYKGVYNGTNNAQASTSHLMDSTNGITLSLDLYRNTYTLTVSAGTNTSNPTISTTAVYEANNAKYFRWGQEVTVGVTKATNVTCTTYATPTWTQSPTSGTIGNTTSSGNNYTLKYGMPKANATVTATSAASNVAQTIYLSRSGGASGITIAGTSYTDSSIQLNCGSYSISGSYSSDYEFNSWSASGSVSVASTSSATTTMTISGPGTLTLVGKQSCVPTITGTTMQSFSVGSTNYCEGATGTLTDSRSGNKTYTVAKIGNRIWMTRNLDLPGGTTLTSADSNVTSNYTLPTSSTDGFSDDVIGNKATAYVYNSNSTTCGNNQPCYSYYSYVAATAGTNPSSRNATSDICPKGWRLPTKAEYDTLKSTYTTGAALTASPFNGVYAGYYSYSSLYDGGSTGYYWSSTAYSALRAYYLQFYSSRASMYDNYKSNGNSVRCVAYYLG